MNNYLKIIVIICIAAIPGRAGAVGRPCLFSDYFAEWRCFPAILLDEEGRLTCGKHLLNQGGLTGAPAAAGPVSATSTRSLAGLGAFGHFVYRDNLGGVQDLWFNRDRERDTWHADALNLGALTGAPAAAGNPVGLAIGKIFHVLYRSQGGGLEDLARDGDGWRWAPVARADGAALPQAEGDPVQLLYQGQRHLLYVEAGGGLRQLWRARDGWHGQLLNMGGATAGPKAVGVPAAVETRAGLEVVYRDRAGELHALVHAGSWRIAALTGEAGTGAPRAAGDPFLAADWGGGPRVLYRDGDGNVLELVREPAGKPADADAGVDAGAALSPGPAGCGAAWRVQRLNLGGATAAPAAASDPVLMVPPSRWQYVAYTDRAGDAQLLIQNQDGVWSVTRLNEGNALGRIRGFPGAPLP